MNRLSDVRTSEARLSTMRKRRWNAGAKRPTRSAKNWLRRRSRMDEQLRAGGR